MPNGNYPLPPLDDEITCTCSSKRGWPGGLPEQPIDGDNWPLDFASCTLGIPKEDLKALIRLSRLQPSGTMKVAAFRRPGRQPRVYPADKLIRLHEMIGTLRAELGTQDHED